MGVLGMIEATAVEEYDGMNLLCTVFRAKGVKGKNR